MTNDLSTLNGSLQQMIDELEENLQSMGVDAEYDPVTGIRGLIAQITDIEASIGGIDVVTKLSVNLSETSVIYGGSVVVSGVLEADKDDISGTNVDLEGYLKGATIKIYHRGSLVGTAITNQDGEYSYNYENISITGTHNVYVVFEGTDNYETCTSENMSLTVGHNISLTSNKQILSYADSDDCTITATYTGGSGATVQLYDEHDKLVTTMTDEGDGTYTYEYVSQGYGDRTFYAKTENLISEEYTIEDCKYYNTMTSSDSINWTNESGVSSSYSSNGVTVSASNWGAMVCNQQITPSAIVEYEITNVTGNGTAYINFWDNENIKFQTHLGNNQITVDTDSSVYSVSSYTGVYTYKIYSDHIELYKDNTLVKSYTVALSTLDIKFTPSNNTSKNFTFKNFKIKLLSEPLELSSDNPILSYVDNDTATITATYIGGDGYDVKLYREFDDSLIGTMTDEGDGTYTYEYTSRGIGDFEVYAKIGNYTSETFVLRDVHFYDSMISDSGHWTYEDGVTESYSSDGVSITSSSDKQPPCDVPLPNNFRLTLKAKSNANNDLRYCVIANWSISNGSYSGTPRFMLFNGWPPQQYVNNTYTQPNIVAFEAEYLNDTLTLKKDGETLITRTVTLNNQLFCLYTGSNHTMTIKDVIIEEL